jgi:hypothetical protein
LTALDDVRGLIATLFPRQHVAEHRLEPEEELSRAATSPCAKGDAQAAVASAEGPMLIKGMIRWTPCDALESKKTHTALCCQSPTGRSCAW